MNTVKENVILFPKWRTKLEEESLLALKEKRYSEALTKLEQLLSYNINNHEIIIGKLICLMELDRYDEAQELCEELLQHKDENYYHYVHIYLTILFQTSQYELLMEQVEYEFSTKAVPDAINEQFKQLYDMSKNMQHEIQNEKSFEYIDELQKAVKEEDHVRQWQLVQQMKQVKASPTVSVKSLLTADKVHPVTKTAIFEWFQEKNVSDKVTVEKLDAQVTLSPAEMPAIKSHTAIKQTLMLINELEQKNPTLFKMVEELLYRYIYVRYPIMPDEKDIPHIARALTAIGKEYLDIHKDESAQVEQPVQAFIEEIKMCETLYLSIIEA